MADTLFSLPQRWSFPDEIGTGGFDESTVDGRRKGRDPLGDAWLFKDATLKSILQNFRYAYI